MSRRIVSGFFSALLFISIVTLAFNIQPAKAEPKTIIVPDDYPTIQEAINHANTEDTIFVKAGTYYENIVINKTLTLIGENNKNTIIDAGGETAIYVKQADDVTITNFTLKNGYHGVYIYKLNGSEISNNIIFNQKQDGIRIDQSEHNTIRDNIIFNVSFSGAPQGGILLLLANNNTVFNNTVYSCRFPGICVCNSNGNLIFSNTVKNNTAGIYVYYESNDNLFTHNSFINNTVQVGTDSINIWDNGYPSGGNYWSDYAGVDLYSGPYQNETGSDGIGDTPYVIDENNQDNYPLMEPWAPVTLTVIGPWAGFEMEKFLSVLEAFEKNTGIDVKYIIYRPEELAYILQAQFAAGQTPGDVIFMPPWYIRQIGPQGHALNVTELINETDFRPGGLDEVKVEGTLYGASYTGTVKPGFWYRKSFFAAHNLTVPQNWTQFISLLDTIKSIPGIKNPIVSGDEVGWPLSDITEHFLITFGGPQLQLQLINGTASWTEDPVQGIFENYLVPLLNAGYFSEPVEWTTALDLWWQGDYALYFMGSWITQMVEDPNDLGVFPLPGTEALVLCADYFFIPAYTDYPDEAKQLFQFLASAEAQKIQVAQGGHIATNIQVPLDAYPSGDREAAEAVEGKEVLPDLDDTIGGEFQTTFWDQLKLLWVDPTKLDEILHALQAVAPRPPTPAVINATINICPQALNLRSRGRWITAYIELPESYDVHAINVSTIMLNDTIAVESKPVAIGDDDDGVPDLMVKFDRQAVIQYVLDNVDIVELFERRFTTVALTITGYLNDGTPFQGNTTVKIIMPMPRGIGRHIFIL